MKINSVIMLSRAFPTVTGGAEKQELELSRALAGRGVKVTALAGRPAGLPAGETLDGVRIKRLSGARGAAAFLFKSFFWLLAHRGEYQAVHARQPYAAAAALAGRLTGRRTFVKVTAADAAVFLLGSPAARLKLALFRAASAELLVANRGAYERLKGARAAAGLRLHYFRAGVDTGRYTPPLYGEKIKAKAALGLDNSPVFLFVGLLSPEKRVREFVETWAQILSEEAVPPKMRLLIVGGGPEEARLRRTVADMGLAGSVTVAGHRDDLLPYYRAADVFILPSLSGELSNSMLEAMACGLAVMANRAGGAGEAVEPGVSGCFFDAGSRQELKACLLGYAADRGLAVKMGEQARRTAVEKYSMARAAGELARIYEEI